MEYIATLTLDDGTVEQRSSTPELVQALVAAIRELYGQPGVDYAARVVTAEIGRVGE